MKKRLLSMLVCAFILWTRTVSPMRMTGISLLTFCASRVLMRSTFMGFPPDFIDGHGDKKGFTQRVGRKSQRTILYSTELI